MSETVVVTGAAGFIGAHVASALAAAPGREVRAVYHHAPLRSLEGVTPIQADLTRREDVVRVLQGCDVLVHAAATTSGARDIVQRPWIHATDNVIMGALLFQAAHELCVKHVVYFSCSVMYPSSDRPLREDDFDASVPLHPKYRAAGATKVYLEQMAAFYAGLGRTRYTVLRHSNIYGPGDKFDLERSHVFGATIRKVMTTEVGTPLTIWGDGEDARDLLYIDDLIALVTRALKEQRSPLELCNAGTGEAISVNALVRRVCEGAGRHFELRHDLSAPQIGSRLSLDSTRAYKCFGWMPEVSLQEGIRRTLLYFEREVLSPGPSPSCLG